LSSFQVADADFFFGRERVVAECVAKVAGSSFLGVVGPSGSGKSSIVRAGLMAALADGVLPGSDGWSVALIRPDAAPTTELYQGVRAALRRSGVEPTGEAVLADMLEALPPGARLVVVVDQFEEVFTVCQDQADRAAFIANAAELTWDPGARAIVVAVVRADFYGRCAEDRALAELLGANHVLVGPLGAEELGRAVELPARAAGLRVEPELIAALVTDVLDEPGGLPLLSTTLLDLWQRRDGRTLRLGTYRELGGVSGAVSRLAEEAFGRLGPAEQSIARAIFMRLASGGEGEVAVRRPAALAELDANGNQDVTRVLAVLTDSRLVTVDDGSVEISHEALLREWPRLRAWLDEDSQGRRLHEHLSGAVRAWAAAGEDPSELYRGARLTATLDWADTHELELNDLERRFLAESRAASEREAERQRRTNRRLRGLLAAAVLFMSVALVASGFAAMQLDRAEHEATNAERAAAQAAAEAELARDAETRAEREASISRSRELSASAIAVLDDDPGLSKLLALAAASIDEPPIESVTALHQAMAADPIVYRYTWPGGRATVNELYTDLDPTGRYVVATGFWFNGPHDYLEVVDRISDQRLWDFEVKEPGLGVGYGYFLPDSSQVVFGVYRQEAPPDGPDPASSSVGVHVRDTLTGDEIQSWDTGACGAVVVAVTGRQALIRTSTRPSCTDPDEPNAERKVALEVLDLGSGARTLVSEHAGLTDEGALSQDGRWLAYQEMAGPRPGPVLVDLETGARTAINVEGTLVRDINHDGSLVLVGEIPLRVWNASTGDSVVLGERLADSGGASYIEFTPDGRSIFSTSGHGNLQQWNPLTGREIGKWSGAYAGRPSATADGLVLVPHWGTPTAALFDTRPRGELRAVDTREAVDLTPADRGCDSEAITAFETLHIVGTYAAYGEYCFGPWSNVNGFRIAIPIATYLVDLTTLAVEHVPSTSSAALSPDGTRLAFQEVAVQGPGVFQSPMRLLDLRTREINDLEGLCAYDQVNLVNAYEREGSGCRQFPDQPFPILPWKIRWSPDGRYVAVVDGIEEYFAVWDARDGTLIREILPLVPLEDQAGTRDVAFTPDSGHLIVSIHDRSSVLGPRLLRISTSSWSIEGERALAVDDESMVFAGFSPTGATLLGFSSYQRGGEALHWIDIETLEDARTRQTRLHDTQLTVVAMSPDRTLLATGAGDGSLRVWETESGRLDHELAFPGKTVDGVAFVDDTHLGVLVGDEGNFLVLTIDTTELLGLARASLTRGFTETECSKYDLNPCPTIQEIRGG
jgi:WD40 repeat protein